ncbi:Endonuclease/Exonuclease/phosphatase family protein [Enhygromyxa salina]|uniref:Endonuclease/Exonuclease/phosphatase family protein n=1 Tax=Enhygromyxa salina TaxID=215803 RepID=A0A2S9YCK1_9BACT|nr:endonuclease/exonuclease/phosphatase family protein [Enhygromyxa salina]PRQ02848.1 Endonuclease/Exonuclease/phosphatase family protein [Enhygromyxa salina]
MAAKRKRKRRLSKRKRAKRRRIAAVLATLIAGLVWAWIGSNMRALTGLAGAGPPRRGDAVRVVSWNLANFRGHASGHDLTRMREVIEALDPDVIAVQEIKDPEALAALLPGWELRLSAKGGRGHQLLGVAWRPERVELLDSAEHPELSIGGRVRPALSAYLRARDGGPDFWLVIVHLKAMPDSVEVRRKQWPKLVDIAADTQTRDGDLIVVGDFNTTGPPGGGRRGPAIEQLELSEALAPAGLRRLTNATGCTAYYDGRRRDAWKEPSEIDLVWVRELDESLDVDAQVHSGTHCASERCGDFRSTEAYPLHDYESVSDHCPVVVDLRRTDDD